MSIREHSEVEIGDATEIDTARAAADSALRQLDVAGGRERHLRQQVDKLEMHLLDKEKELAKRERELRAQAELVGEIQRTLSWRLTRPLRAVRRLRPRA